MRRVAIVVLGIGALVSLLLWLRATRQIPVLALEITRPNSPEVGPERRFYAADRVRYEATDGVVVLVRLDKHEVWTWNDTDRRCTVYPIDELMGEIDVVNRILLIVAENDPQWRDDLGALKDVLHGEYEIETLPWTVQRMGYECVPIKARVGNVFQTEDLRASGHDLPRSIGQADRVLAAFGGMVGYGGVWYHWGEKARTAGTVFIEGKTFLRLPGPLGEMELHSRVVSIEHRRLGKHLFEIPRGYEIERWHANE